MTNQNSRAFHRVILGILLCTSNSAKADIHQENAFLYGDNIEVGIGPDGAFGSNVISQDSGRKSNGKQLGYISDPTGNNFQASYHGDFFLPGRPEEGWGVSFDGNAFNNNSNQQGARIIGSLTGFKESLSGQSVIWTGAKNGLEITQVYRVYTLGTAIVIDVTLKNTTSTTMNDVYYMRTVDPDNNAEQDPADISEKYETTNTIISQGYNREGFSAVSAMQAANSGENFSFTRSLLTLNGYGENSRVTYGGIENRNPIDVYNGTVALKQSGAFKADEAISLAFKYEQLEAGDSVTFRAGYQLKDVPVADLDINSSESSGNEFTQLYILGSDAIKVTDSDTEIKGDGFTQIQEAAITITNPHDGDKLEIIGTLPGDITVNSDDSSDTKIYLTELGSVADYQTALTQIVFKNTNTQANIETRKITVQVTDNNATPSNTAISTVKMTTPIVLDNTVIAGDNIVNGDEVNNVSLTGQAAPNTTIIIDFTDKNGKKLSPPKTVTTDENGNWTLDDDPANLSNLSDGPITVLITATDPNGNITTLTQEIIKNTLIVLTDITPVDNQLISSMSPVYEGKTDPNASITLKILPNGKVYTTTADANGDWSIQLDTFPMDVTTSVQITAEDEYENETSSTLTFKTPKLPLEITELDVDNQGLANTTMPTLQGTSNPNTSITINMPTVNGKTTTCSTTTDSEGNWSCTLPSSPSGGPYTLTVTTADTDGNTNSVSRDISIPGLSLVVGTPTDNELVSSTTPIFKGKTEPNTTVTLKILPNGKLYTTTSDAEGNWEIQLDPLPKNETISVQVTATDAAGNESSTSQKIKTPNLPIDVTSLDANRQGLARSATPTIQGTSEPNTSITINMPTKNGKSTRCSATTDADGKWRCKLPVSPSGGPYTLTVTTTDSGGNTNSTTRQLTIPKLRLGVDSPTDNQLVSGSTPTFKGKTEPNASVTLKILPDGKTYSVTADKNGDWSIQLDPLPKGETISVKVTAINASGDEASVTKTIRTPNLPIDVSDLDVNDKGVAHSTTPLLKGTSEPNTRITINMPTGNGQSISCSTTTDALGNWSCKLPVSPSGGPYTITITTTDDNGNTNSTSKQISIPELPLVVDSPTNNDVISGDKPEVRGTSNPGTNITVLVSNGEKCTAVTDDTNHWRCELPSLAFDNSYTLTVTTEDSIKNQTTETLDVKTKSLPLSVISPEDGGIAEDTTPTFIGTTTPNTTVTVTATSGQECTAKADSEGRWSCELPALPVGGPYTVTITAEDSNGTITSISETITIPKIPLVITSPTETELIKGDTLTVTGNSDPNTPIRVISADGESCETTSDNNGAWSCELNNLQSGDDQNITVISGDDTNGKKVAITNIDVENSSEKVKTILGGSASLPMLFLLSFFMLLSHTRKRIIKKSAQS